MEHLKKLKPFGKFWKVFKIWKNLKFFRKFRKFSKIEIFWKILEIFWKFWKQIGNFGNFWKRLQNARNQGVWRTDGPTDQRTDRVTYRVACTRLIISILNHLPHSQTRTWSTPLYSISWQYRVLSSETDCRDWRPVADIGRIWALSWRASDIIHG